MLFFDAHITAKHRLIKDRSFHRIAEAGTCTSLNTGIVFRRISFGGCLLLLNRIVPLSTFGPWIFHRYILRLLIVFGRRGLFLIIVTPCDLKIIEQEVLFKINALSVDV